MKLIEFLAAAECDLDESISYYNQRQQNLGYEFSDEVKRALFRLLNFPSAWPKLSKNTRRIQMNRFPYGIIYQNRPDKILVIAIMNLYSKPSSWKERGKKKTTGDD